MSWRILLATFLHAIIFIMILWWMIFAGALINRYEPHMANHRHMLLWEGSTLLLLVLITGGITVYLLLQEKGQMRKLEEFVAGFTHDLKTALARVRLQTESLRADNRDSSLDVMFNRLITDTSRLEMQVQNSLFIGTRARSNHSLEGSLHLEAQSLRSLIEILKDAWPQVEIDCNISKGQDAILNVDNRAMESVLGNLVHNSIIHGQAGRIAIEVESVPDGVRLRVRDNGQGFNGDIERLGEMFFRHNPSSGSGLGLFTVKSYVERMKGSVQFVGLAGIASVAGVAGTASVTDVAGFCVELTLPGAIKA